MDTNETFIVTGLNDKPLNILQHLFKVSTLRPAHNHEDVHAILIALPMMAWSMPGQTCTKRCLSSSTLCTRD